MTTNLFEFMGICLGMGFVIALGHRVVSIYLVHREFQKILARRKRRKK